MCKMKIQQWQFGLQLRGRGKAYNSKNIHAVKIKPQIFKGQEENETDGIKANHRDVIQALEILRWIANIVTKFQTNCKNSKTIKPEIKLKRENFMIRQVLQPVTPSWNKQMNE